jgi:hypothetical protein
MHESQTGRLTCHLKRDADFNEIDAQIPLNNPISIAFGGNYFTAVIRIQLSVYRQRGKTAARSRERNFILALCN